MNGTDTETLDPGTAEDQAEPETFADSLLPADDGHDEDPPAVALAEGTHAVVVTVPGEAPIKFGALTHHVAERWHVSLLQRLHRAPEGTTIEVAPFVWGEGPYTAPSTIPDSANALADLLRIPQGAPTGFPDPFDLLVMVNGYDRARGMWDDAMSQLGQEEAGDQAIHAIDSDWKAAHALIAQAGTDLAQAASLMDRAMAASRQWGLTVTEDDIDARAHLHAGQRELRAADRALTVTEYPV